MKKYLDNIKNVFSFTLRQRIFSGSWRAITVVIALLLLLAPPAIMAAAELFSSKEAVSVPDSVYVADISGDETFNFSLLSLLSSASDSKDYSHIHYESVESSDADTAVNKAIEAAKASEGNALALVLSRNGGGYEASIIKPNGSGLTSDDVDSYEDFLGNYIQLIALFKSGISLQKLVESSSLSFTSSFYVNEDGIETLMSGDLATKAQNTDASVKDVLGFLLPFVNVMLLYFLILFYGQSTANSVVLEKSSKLMDTMLISVKPEALVTGKVLAQALASILQSLIWVLSLVLGLRIGIYLACAINPKTDSFIVSGFRSMGLLSSIFSPIHIVFFMLFLAAGLFLYLALSSISGAIAGKQEDIGMTSYVYVVMLIISFYLVLAKCFNNISAVSWLDWMPFTSILIAPAHVFLGSLSLPLACTSLALVILLAIAVMAAAGRLYRAMSMYKGNVPKPTQILKMLL